MSKSILLQPWSGKHGGVPPWDQILPEEFPDAFDSAIDEANAEIRAIADANEPATFDNTLEALERTGQTLDRLTSMFGVHAGNLNLGPIPEIESVVAQKLAAWHDSVVQNPKLFARVKEVKNGEAFKELTAVQQRLVEERFKSFVRRGANLSDDDKAELSELNSQLAGLYTQFSQNVLADEEKYVTWIEQQDRLAGLPESLIDSMAAAATAKGQPDKWAIESFVNKCGERTLAVATTETKTITRRSSPRS